MKNLFEKLVNFWKTGKNGKAIIIVVAVLLLACICCAGTLLWGNKLASSPTYQATSTAKVAITQTWEARPSETPVPSQTPSPTFTPRPTNTPTLTFTPIPPEVLTAQALALTQTRTAFDATSTRQAYTDRQTATAQAHAAQATLMAGYKDIYWKELVSYADNHIGETVKISIRVFNIISDTQLQGYFSGTYEAVIVVMREPYTGIYENDAITVYGTVYGLQCGTNAFGGTVCQPMLTDAFYTKP